METSVNNSKFHSPNESYRKSPWGSHGSEGSDETSRACSRSSFDSRRQSNRKRRRSYRSRSFYNRSKSRSHHRAEHPYIKHRNGPKHRCCRSHRSESSDSCSSYDSVRSCTQEKSVPSKEQSKPQPQEITIKIKVDEECYLMGACETAVPKYNMQKNLSQLRRILNICTETLLSQNANNDDRDSVNNTSGSTSHTITTETISTQTEKLTDIGQNINLMTIPSYCEGNEESTHNDNVLRTVENAPAPDNLIEMCAEETIAAATGSACGISQPITTGTTNTQTEKSSDVRQDINLISSHPDANGENTHNDNNVETGENARDHLIINAEETFTSDSNERDKLLTSHKENEMKKFNEGEQELSGSNSQQIHDLNGIPGVNEDDALNAGQEFEVDNEKGTTICSVNLLPNLPKTRVVEKQVTSEATKKQQQHEDSESIIGGSSVCSCNVVNVHPSYHFFSSRVAPHVAELLRDSKAVHQCKKLFERAISRYNYSQCCYFCNETKTMDKSTWINHIARHTSYYQYECSHCSKLFADRANHKRCRMCPENGKVDFVLVPSQIQFVAQFDKNIVMAYLCDLCNFVRFDKNDIQNHLKTEHGGGNNVRYKAVIFLKFPQGRETVSWPNVSASTTTTSTIKNNNPEWHSMSNGKNCKICKKDVRSLVTHYVNVHPSREVFPSRLSPELATLLRNSNGIGQCKLMLLKDGHQSYQQLCYFCNELKCCRKGTWIQHLITHTGYYKLKCTDCMEIFSKRSDHGCTGEYILKRCSQPQFAGDNVTGYLCDLCNYVRFTKEEIEKHLICEHEGDAIGKFKEFIFLRFPKARNAQPIIEKIEIDEAPNTIDTAVEDLSSTMNERISTIPPESGNESDNDWETCN